ncbi:MAG: endonuclease MutS2 [Clostridiales bacterium]|nr:endonuclease MutS2 [Clostridiales bacterium]
MMTERTLRVLEFPRIREMLAEGALTAIGAEKCRELVPFDTMYDIELAQRETEEATVILQYVGGHPMTEFPDARQALTVCEKGGSLSPGMLLSVAALLRASRAARDVLITDRENTPLLRERAEMLTEARNVERDITDAILSEDEIADRASSELMNIRRHLRGAQDRIKEKLNQMIRSSAMQKYLQESIITVRNDRYVIPVRAEYRAQVPGLVHDQSTSGATLFIEPMAAVEMGNEIREWEIKEAREIERILAALSAEVEPFAVRLRENVEMLGELDFIFAKGLLSRRLYCVAPKMNEKGFLHILRGRHPLIPPEKVVPSDILLGYAPAEDSERGIKGKDSAQESGLKTAGDTGERESRERRDKPDRDTGTGFNTLVITGPNTGGKTVTLKTIGLLTLMAQAGLQVPAELGTEIAVFEQVWADIGDEQSIEQSLSTFSGHMTNIVDIMRNVTPRDLVLFDELGAGTDPTEGAALAQSILTRLLHIRVRTVATTHYSELKVFALTTEGVENASVEFNVETLRPTYRLSIGVPGKSNAFEISRRLGLPENLIEGAKKLLSSDEVRFEDVIANAEYHRQIAERERQLAQEASRETIRLRDEAEKLRREMEEKREQSVRKAREEARRILQDARRESESIISDLKRMKKEAGSAADVNALRRRLDLGIDDLSEGLKQPAPEEGEAPKTVHPGDLVKVLTFGTEASVLSEPNSRGEVELASGNMKFKARLADLRIVRAEKPKEKTVVRTQTGTMSRTVPMECDVRGMNLEEALSAVGIYLDEAVMAGLREVSIIHGKGTGVLKAGIRQDLRKNRHVKSCRPGMYGEGEDGVTVVTLK